MDRTSLSALLAPYLPAEEMDERLLSTVQMHLELLLRWNQRMNLTGLRTPEEIVARHFGESLFAARQLLPRQATISVFDLGSGAGFPGLPLKYWSPGIQLKLIEGHGKKATFLREVVRAVGLTGITVLDQRGEQVAEQAELVTMRAVEKFDSALPVAARLVAPGGRLGLLIGQEQSEHAMNLLPEGEHSSIVLPGSAQRILLTWHTPHSQN
jgi:16S rRNA (guanine527-N7)-methyltransferase